MKENTTGWKFVLMMLLCVVVWALAFPFIRMTLDEGLSPINLTIMRFFVVCVVFLIILLLKSNKFSKLHKKDVLPIFALGFSGVMVYHLGLNYGEQYVSPGAASLIIATIPIYIVFLAFIFLKEKITARQIFGIVLALCGVLIISIWGKEDVFFEIKYLTALIAILIAAIMGAVYTIAGKKLLERYSALSLTVYAMLFGSLGLIPFFRLSLFSELADLSLTGWLLIIFLGVFSTVIGYFIWYVALEIKPASEIGIYLYLVPVFSTIASYFLLGHAITIFFIFGGAIVIIGLYLVNRKNRKRVRKFL